MSCCNGKKIARIMRGQKDMVVSVVLDGLGEWDLQNPPADHEFVVTINVGRPVGGELVPPLPGVIVGSNEISFVLDAYEDGDTFYEPGMYSISVSVALWEVPHGAEPVAVRVFDTDTCILIYEKAVCPPPC